MSARTSFLALLLLAACSPTPSTPAPTVEPVVVPGSSGPPVVDAVALARARTAMSTLGTTLKGTLVATMSTEGPTAAMEVCSQDAMSLTATVAANTSVTVGRSSLRLRNPDNAAPSWVQEWLEGQGERPAENVEGQQTTAVLADGTAVVRVVAPLPIEAPCLVCHGPNEGRLPELTEALTAKYPEDHATGYVIGDLRGAIWAEAPVVDSGLELVANGDAKWPMDESTREAIGELRTALAGPALTDMPATAALAEGLDASLTKMVQGCTMDGASHDQLHHFLGVFFPTLDALKAATTVQAANDTRILLQVQVIEYDMFFE